MKLAITDIVLVQKKNRESEVFSFALFAQQRWL